MGTRALDAIQSTRADTGTICRQRLLWHLTSFMTLLQFCPYRGLDLSLCRFVCKAHYACPAVTSTWWPLSWR